MPIKNFISPFSIVKKKEKSILVKDYMIRDLIIFHPEQKLIQAVHYLINNKISGAPVVDENENLVGVITEYDYMHYISDSSYFGRPMNGALVKDYMSEYIDSVRADDSIFYAAHLFFTLKRKRLVVLENGKLIGQLTRKEVLKAVLG